ncbi:MAG: RHS repeat-associated core domain-containing protein, partial [Bacteroidota bacterium]
FNNVTENLLLQGQTKTASFAYDSYGNVLQEIENNGVEITTISTSYGQYGGPMPNRPLIMHVNRQRAGQIPHYFTQRNYYNSIGQLTSKVDFYGYPKAVTTSFAYNNLGNVIVKTISSSGLSPRQTTKSYDSRGRFVVGMTNPMGYGESATYDNKWGKKLSVTGIDGLTTTFQYDVFGRRTRTTLPTGVVINEYYPFFVSSTFGSTYCHNITQVGKPDQWHYFDKLGRKVRHHRKTYNNDTVQEIWTFDTRGRLKTVRAPYKSGETTFTTTLNYDTYNRRTSESNPFGTTTYSYSFSGGKSKITKTNAAGQVTTVEMDASGVRTKATDNGGTLNYIHDSQGQIKEVKLGNTVMATVTHDPYGNKVQVIDKNAGTISYAYNAYKELTSQTNANGHTYYMAYNNLGQIIRRNGPGEDRRYFYYGSGVAKGKVYYVYNILSADREYYYYDSYGRVRQKLERIDGPYLSTRLTYNNYNDVTSKTYPSGLKLDYSYDSNGFLTTIKHLATNHTLFTTQAMNGREQYTSYKLGNNKTTAITYNQGVPTRYRSTGIQDLIMSWNYTNGNLNYRYDAIKARYESFTYDNLNRLKTAQVSGQPTKSVNYAANGNITSKTDVGNYYYPPGKNNAVIRVSNSSSTIPTVTQDISYTQFDQPSKVSEGNFELDYTYGQDRQRIKSVLKENGVTKAIRLYLGDFERQTKQGAVKDIHYVDAGQGTVAMVVKYNGVYQFYYTYTDHLGSILRVTDANATTVAEQNFDAWGRKRNASTWTYANVNSVPDWLYRGYTSHEEMPEFDLINMNGRLYDPIVGRMLAVDNHVQSPNSTQNYNRYTYALNNPLSYTDPSGEVLWYVPVIVGAVVGAYAGASIASGSWNFTNWTSAAWKGAIVGAFVGAAAGAMFAAAIGASGITTGAAATGTVQTATQAGAAVGASLAPGTGAATVGASASTTAAAATGKSLTAAWSITTSALKGANIKMAVTAVTGGDLDKIYKAGLVGAALGGYKGVFDVTKGFGLADSWGWKLTLLNKAVYTGLESIGGNWINGDPLFYGFILEVGPARFSFGKKYEGEPIWRWQDNIGSLLPEAITLLGWAAGGTPGYDLDKLTLTSTGGWFSTLPELNKIDKTIVPSGKDWISFIGQIFSKLGAS